MTTSYWLSWPRLSGFAKNLLSMLLVMALLAAPEVGAGGIETERTAHDCIESRFDADQHKPRALSISARIFHPDLDREIQITIARKSDDSPLDVSVVEARGSSIEQQLSHLQEKDPHASADELCHSVQLDHYDLAMSQEELAALVDAFEQLRISPMPPSTITVHGIQTSISASTWMATTFYEYSGSGWSNEDTLPPLQNWVRSLFLAVLPSSSGVEDSSTTTAPSERLSSGEENGG